MGKPRSGAKPRRSVAQAWRLPDDAPFVALPLALLELCAAQRLCPSALFVVALLVDSWEPARSSYAFVSVREIAARSPLSKSQVHRLLAELAQKGLVLPTPGSRGFDLAPLIEAVGTHEKHQRAGIPLFEPELSRPRDNSGSLSTGFPQEGSAVPPAGQSVPRLSRRRDKVSRGQPQFPGHRQISRQMRAGGASSAPGAPAARAGAVGPQDGIPMPPRVREELQGFGIAPPTTLSPQERDAHRQRVLEQAEQLRYETNGHGTA